jgi:hypothetical protein
MRVYRTFGGHRKTLVVISNKIRQPGIGGIFIIYPGCVANIPKAATRTYLRAKLSC